jgi:hypothetical protein
VARQLISGPLRRIGERGKAAIDGPVVRMGGPCAAVRLERAGKPGVRWQPSHEARKHRKTVNADAKQHRGLDQLSLRGLDKVLGSAFLFALTYNILRLISLRG